MMRYSNLTTIYYSNLLMIWVRYDETFLIKEKWWYLYIFFAYTFLSIKSIHIYTSIYLITLSTAISLSTAICEWDMMRPPQSRKSDNIYTYLRIHYYLYNLYNPYTSIYLYKSFTIYLSIAMMNLWWWHMMTPPQSRKINNISIHICVYIIIYTIHTIHTHLYIYLYNTIF